MPTALTGLAETSASWGKADMAPAYRNVGADPMRSPMPRPQGEMLHPDMLTLDGRAWNLMTGHAL